MKNYFKPIAGLLFNMIVQSAFGQYTSSSSLVQSPNAASLGVYNKVEISPFTGLPNINVPVFSLKHGDIPILAELKYFGGGVKPEAHPGWVGQNWSLSVGGVVTRKVNGGVDEIAVSNFTNDAIAAYFYHYGELNNTSWSDNGFIQNTWAKPGKNQNNDYLAVPAPDEFMFSLPNGVSGSFFLNHEGNWVVKSSSGNYLKVNVAVNNQPFALLNPDTQIASHIKRIIYHITITDHDGTIYTFGNNQNAIEFNRGPIQSVTANNEDIIANAWYLTKIESSKGNIVEFKYQRKSNQYIQSVTYSKAFGHNISNYVYQTFGFGGAAKSFNSRIYSAQIISPVYLEEIQSSSFKVIFQIEETTELKYNYDADAFNGFPYYDLGMDYSSGLEFLTLHPPKWYKLSGIQIYDYNNIQTEDLAFNYNDNPNQRLFLEKFSKRAGLTSSQDYNFAYDLTPLPVYNSFQVDQWGYFNGKQFPFTGNYTKESLLPFFKPDEDLMQAGTLLKITYPTGGYSQFYYEPNTYSKTLVQQNNNITLNDQAGIGGGLRIKSVVENSWDGVQSSREYFYENNGSPVTSSGILAGSRNIYYNYQIGNPILGYSEFITTSTLEDLNYTNGRDVVYSEVKEKLTDGSYTIYKYSNSDNINYRDEAPITVFSQSVIIPTMDIRTWILGASSNANPIKAFTSRELERGNLLSKEVYNSSNKVVYKLTNEYRDDPGRFNEYVRSIDRYTTAVSVSGDFNEVRDDYYQPIKIYTYSLYLKKQTELTFDKEGTNPVTVIKNFTIDPKYNYLKEEKTYRSNNSETKTVYRYSPDIVGTEDQSGIYNKMTLRNMISPVIEEKKYIDQQQVSFKRNNYSEPFANKYLLKSIQAQQKSNDPLEVRVLYNYDESGNIINQSAPEGLINSYQWGYRKQLPVAEAKNAMPSEVYYNSFEDIGTPNNLTPAHTGFNSYVGNTYTVNWQAPNNKNYTVAYWYLLNGSWRHKELPYAASLTLTGGEAYDDVIIYPSDALVSTYTYRPLVGLSSKIDDKGETTYYQYDPFNRLLHVKNQDRNIVKTFKYNLRPKKFGNVPVFKRFTPQCPVGYTAGPPVAYRVPVNKYIENTQKKADSLALADLNSNGQQYANEHGECKVQLNEVTFTYLDGIIGENNETCYVTLKNVNSSQYFSVAFKNVYDQSKLNIPSGEYDVIIDFPNPVSYYYNGGFDFTGGSYISFSGYSAPSSYQFTKRVTLSGNTNFAFTFLMR
ncbi:hypothetical protein DBR11_04405 [Pedobacter sp. HMWF019]|uniref:DUF5977 domain-containing protein n=1 Tax=Pedobacter sp. HMWF019 TaxID=2056856 RepID=UPI000D378C5F|nr:DUF5977 domain-containing protein [Pedobacter sp. HMWF019]PTT02577.1 hypothetical protein DBR11_04405 [Pedobacter sp. HMWF019]